MPRCQHSRFELWEHHFLSSSIGGYVATCKTTEARNCKAAAAQSSWGKFVARKQLFPPQHLPTLNRQNTWHQKICAIFAPLQLPQQKWQPTEYNIRQHCRPSICVVSIEFDKQIQANPSGLSISSFCLKSDFYGCNFRLMSNQAFSHQPGTAIECLSIPITLHKEENKCGFKIGGGIDQDYRKSPQGCEIITLLLRQESW